MTIMRKFKKIQNWLLLTLPVGLMAYGPGDLDSSSGIAVPRPRFGLSGTLGCLFGDAPACQNSASGLILSVIDIALWIAGTIAVLFLIIGGLRYVTASGNEEQAEGAKKTITHAIIGLVIIILSFVIVRIISNALIGGRV